MRTLKGTVGQNERATLDRQRRDPFADRQRERVAIPLQVGDDLIARHESVRVVAVVWPVRKLDGPVRRDEAEGVPSVAPALPDASGLEHDMLNAIALELSTGGQPCLATADNDRFEFFHRPSLARHRGRT